MKVNEINWKNGQGPEDFITWGINPIKTLAHYIQCENNGELNVEPLNKTNKQIENLASLIEDLCEDAKECIQRFFSENTFSPLGMVTDVTKEFRSNEDYLDHFFKECCVFDSYYVDTEETALYEKFKEWYRSNVANKVPEKKWFANMMIKKFNRVKGKSGRYFYDGLILKEE
ncbi:MAG: hypothetical protein SRB2_02150 [Desulfobacteraceae bacterium Eth-SRB2]|nr:MAG: hypothetical protein SRB2_02150 [Desulfobacteraceae bacterium Eth-SRB2]